MLRWGIIALLVAAPLTVSAAEQQTTPLDWSHYVRIAGHGLSRQNIAATIEESQRTHVFGIEVDNDVPGRYESFLDPTEKLAAIRLAAQAAHAVHNKAFVYIAGLECITAHADQSPHTFFKDHPDWVQRNREGQPALFGGGTAFWIAKGDEDVWISPYAPAWRARYMQLVHQIAGTGIDGVYVDIPYWMTHFDKWENSWASFDRYTVEAFRKQTGLDARNIKLGDPSDPGFRRWIDFRIATITDFMRDIDTNVKSANPHCLTIAEIFPGIESAVPRVGADVYQLYPVVDAIAHEYQGPSDATAASRSPFNWLDVMVGMFAFRSFADGKATWMLNYSWDNDKDVNIPDAMKTLFASQLIAGANTWDAKGHVMSGSNDSAVRTQVFGWIAQHEHTFYDPRHPIDPIGVYFSPTARDYFPDEVVSQFKAAMNLLLLTHREFEIVTPRNIDRFHGKAIIIPAQERIASGEMQRLNELITHGVRRLDFPSELPAFQRLLEQHYGDTAAIQPQLENLASRLPAPSGIVIHAPPTVVSQTAQVSGKPYVFLLNLKGLEAKRKLTPDTESTVSIDFAADPGSHVFALPFLGQTREMPVEQTAGKLHVQVPAFERSIVLWCGKH